MKVSVSKALGNALAERREEEEDQYPHCLFLIKGESHRLNSLMGGEDEVEELKGEEDSNGSLITWEVVEKGELTIESLVDMVKEMLDKKKGYDHSKRLTNVKSDLKQEKKNVVDEKGEKEKGCCSIS